MRVPGNPRLLLAGEPFGTLWDIAYEADAFHYGPAVLTQAERVEPVFATSRT